MWTAFTISVDSDSEFDVFLALTHAWVSADMMLDACLVGFLVAERAS